MNLRDCLLGDVEDKFVAWLPNRGVARNLIWVGINGSTRQNNHKKFKVDWFGGYIGMGGIYTYIPPVATPLLPNSCKRRKPRQPALRNYVQKPNTMLKCRQVKLHVSLNCYVRSLCCYRCSLNNDYCVIYTVKCDILQHSVSFRRPGRSLCSSDPLYKLD